MSDPLTINGSILRQSRETLGWSHGEVASRACLSVKQVKQLEEGGASSFYSDNVKLTAARKVAGILGLSEHDLLGRPQVEQAPDESQEHDIQNASHQTNSETGVHPKSSTEDAELAPALELPVQAPSASQSTSLEVKHPILTPGVQALSIRSEALHFLAQPPEEGQEDHHFADHSDEPNKDSKDKAHANANAATQVPESEGAESATQSQGQANSDHHDHIEEQNSADTVSNSEHDAEASASDNHESAEPTSEPVKSSSASNLFKIIVLFLLALGIAAFFAQKTNEEHAEPAPPLQTVPDATGPAADGAVKSEEGANSVSTGTPTGSAPASPSAPTGNNGSSSGSSTSPSSVNSAAPSNSGKPNNPAPSKSPIGETKPSTPAAPPSSVAPVTAPPVPASQSNTNSSSSNSSNSASSPTN